MFQVYLVYSHEQRTHERPYFQPWACKALRLYHRTNRRVESCAHSHSMAIYETWRLEWGNERKCIFLSLRLRCENNVKYLIINYRLLWQHLPFTCQQVGSIRIQRNNSFSAILLCDYLWHVQIFIRKLNVNLRYWFYRIKKFNKYVCNFRHQ